GAAARGDVGDAVRHFELFDCGKRVAAARDRKSAARGYRFRHGARAGGELGMLENAERAVPDDGTGGGEPRGVSFGRLGTNVEDHFLGAYFGDLLDAAFDVRLETLADHDVRRQRNGRSAE